MDLRCHNGILHGKLDDGMVEVTCKSRRCGKEPGVVVVHRFSVLDGTLIDTKRFRDPSGKETGDASRECTSLRSA